MKISYLITVTCLSTLCGLSTNPTLGSELDAYGGFTDVVGQRTGFFHTEQIDDRWWLVSPEGHGFFGVGISHPVTGKSRAAVTFAYKGDQEAWMWDGIRKMRELGYNCVWSGPYSQCRIRADFVDTHLAERVYREAKIPHAIQVPLIKHAVELAPGEKRPDVFSNEYRQFVVDRVAEYVRPNQDNPWVLGYYYGFGCFMRKDAWVNETLAREPESPGRQHFTGILERRYDGDIGQFNRIYQTSYGSFDDLRRGEVLSYPRWISGVLSGYADPPNREGVDRMLADFEEVFEELAVQVYKVAFDEIRRHDKNHMILGGYVKDATYPTRTWVRLAPYIDVLAPQDLSSTNPVRAHIEATGKPALLSDQEFGNVYPLSIQGTPFTPGSVPEHVDRRVLYDLEAARIARDPGMIGVSFCACLFDQSHWISTYDRGQPGFYAIDGEPGEPDLLEVVTRVNARVMESVHSPLDAAAIDKIDRAFHETRESYRTIMRMRMQLLQKTKSEK